jgi:flagellar biosynthesis regulator FlbT
MTNWLNGTRGGINIVAVSAALLIGGCGPDTPKCDDPAVIELVKNITREQITARAQPILAAAAAHGSQPNIPPGEKAEAGKLVATVKERIAQSALALESILVDGYDKDIGKYQCKAKLAASIPADLIDALKSNEMMAAQLAISGAMVGRNMFEELKSTSDMVSYTVQLTAKENRIYVELKGMDKVVDSYQLVFSALVMSGLNRISAERLRIEQQAKAAEAEARANAEEEIRAEQKAEYERQVAERELERRAKEAELMRQNPSYRPKKG